MARERLSPPEDPNAYDELFHAYEDLHRLMEAGHLETLLNVTDAIASYSTFTIEETAREANEAAETLFSKIGWLIIALEERYEGSTT